MMSQLLAALVYNVPRDEQKITLYTESISCTELKNMCIMSVCSDLTEQRWDLKRSKNCDIRF